MNTMNFRGRRSQRGLTLLEILVALTIGALVIGGAIQIFLTNKQAYRLQEEASRLQENGRFVVDLLNRQIRMAGYRTRPPSPERPIAPHDILFPIKATSTLWTTEGQVVAGVDAVNSGVQTDSVSIRLQGEDDGHIIDCLGNSITSGDIVEMTFDLAFDAEGIGNLGCQVTDAAGAGPRTALIDGVQGMAVVYGLNGGDANQRTVVSYVNATGVTRWSQVLSVHIALWLASEEDFIVTAIPTAADDPSFSFPPPSFLQTFDDGLVANLATDRRLRRNFVTTVNLRNRTR